MVTLGDVLPEGADRVDRDRPDVGPVGVLGSIQLIGITANLAELVNLSGGQVFLVAGFVIAGLALIALFTKEYTDSRPRLVVAAATFVVSGMAVGLAITGDDRAAAADPLPTATAASSSPATSAAPSQSPAGWAQITAPGNGDEVRRCQVDVRIKGSPAPGKALVVATKQQDAAYYFEPQLQTDGDELVARVQLGQRDPTDDEKYAIIVYQLDKEWVPYLGTVLTGAARDWDITGEVDATYWNTEALPPQTGKALSQVAVHRAARSDPNCPE